MVVLVWFVEWRSICLFYIYISNYISIYWGCIFGMRRVTGTIQSKNKNPFLHKIIQLQHRSAATKSPSSDPETMYEDFKIWLTGKRKRTEVSSIAKESVFLATQSVQII